MNSYDIISKSIRDYVEFLMDMDWMVDHAYIAHFYQSYKPVTDFEECTEICYYQPGDDTVEFEMDFCEGQKYVKDLSIIPLYKVGEIMKTDFKCAWPYVEKYDYMEDIKHENK